jgi:hypothetical protein
MLDAGLRISEACIKCKNFDFKNRNITIQSAKKEAKRELFQYQTDFTKLSRYLKE